VQISQIGCACSTETFSSRETETVESFLPALVSSGTITLDVSWPLARIHLLEVEV